MFGDKTVGAAYVHCLPTHPHPYEREGTSSQRSDLCIQCDDTVPFGNETTTNVTFRLSLDGTFEDVKDTETYMYYKPVKVGAVKPDMGTKDGGTTVQVWG